MSEVEPLNGSTYVLAPSIWQSDLRSTNSVGTCVKSISLAIAWVDKGATQGSTG